MISFFSCQSFREGAMLWRGFTTSGATNICKKKTWNFIVEAAKKILIVFGQWAFHVSLKKLGLLAMLRSGSGIFEKDFKQCQYRVQKTCVIPQMRNSKSKLIKLIVEKHLWLQLMLGIWRCCCRWVEKNNFVAMYRSFCYRYMVCTSEKNKSDVILKAQNSPAKGQIHCTPSPLPWVCRRSVPPHLRVLAKAIPSAKLKGEVIQKAAQMRQSSGSLLHASSLNRQQKSPRTIGNHEFPLHVLRVIKVITYMFRSYNLHCSWVFRVQRNMFLVGCRYLNKIRRWQFVGEVKTRYPTTLSNCLVLPPAYTYQKNGFDIAHSFLGVGLSLLQTSKPSWLVAHTWEQNWSKLYTEYRHEWKQYEYVKIQLWFLIFSSYRICSLPFSVPNMKHTHTHIWNHHLRHHIFFALLSVNLHTKSPHVTSFCSWLLWGEYKPRVENTPSHSHRIPKHSMYGMVYLPTFG